jgi:hypothetical protein
MNTDLTKEFLTINIQHQIEEIDSQKDKLLEQIKKLREEQKLISKEIKINFKSIDYLEDRKSNLICKFMNEYKLLRKDNINGN